MGCALPVARGGEVDKVLSTAAVKGEDIWDKKGTAVRLGNPEALGSVTS